MNELRKLAGTIWKIARSTPLEIRLSGGEHQRSIYNTLTKRHSRFPLIQAKSFGAALFKIPAPGQPLYSGKQFQAARTNQTRAIKAGYSFKPFKASDFVDQMLAIHASAPERQGRTLDRRYLDRSDVEAYCEQPGHWFGVFDNEGTLRAYCHVPVAGELAILSRILGDDRHLQNGVVWYLVFQTAKALQEIRDDAERPVWLMYDTYIGGEDGLREFKTRMGFRPYRVRWKWYGIGG